MCLICVEFDKGRLTIPEALNNTREMDDYKHIIDVIKHVWPKVPDDVKENIRRQIGSILDEKV